GGDSFAEEGGRGLRLVLMIMMILSLGAYAHAARAQQDAPAPLYVDPGSRGGPCDDNAPTVIATTPLCTVGAGLRRVAPGGRIIMRESVYPQLVVTGRSWPSTVTLQGAPGERVVVPGV